MIGPDIAAALPELRAQAESLMTDTCTIDRQTTTWDEVEQESVTTWTTIHADVPCSLLPPSGGRGVVTDELATAELRSVRLPYGTDGIQEDDRVTVAGVGVLWVSHVKVRTHQTTTRLDCRWVR